jgi:hypothetical protein
VKVLPLSRTPSNKKRRKEKREEKYRWVRYCGCMRI